MLELTAVNSKPETAAEVTCYINILSQKRKPGHFEKFFKEKKIFRASWKRLFNS